MNFEFRTVGIALAVAAVGGCTVNHKQDYRSKIVPVHGVVRLSGKPVEGARVDFINTAAEGASASAVTDADGKFTLTTYQLGDGAPPGNYNIAVTKVQEPGRHGAATAPPVFQRGGGAPKPHWLVPQRYGNPATSKLTAEVSESENKEIILDLQG